MPHKQAGTYTIAGKTYPSQYAYRKALAEQKGFESVPQYRATRSAERFLERLTPSRRSTYDRVLEAIGIARNNPDRSLSKIAKEVGTTTKTIGKYAGSAVERSGGRYRVGESDTLPRKMQVLMPDGIEKVVVRDSREASLLGRYSAALKKYQQTGDPSVLEPFKGKSVTVRGKKVELVTDTDTIDRLTRAGVIDEYEPYERSLVTG